MRFPLLPTRPEALRFPPAERQGLEKNIVRMLAEVTRGMEP